MRPRNVHAGVPKPLEDVTLRALARDPDRRFPSAAAFRAALLAAGRDRPAPPVVPTDTSGTDATAAVFPPVPARDATPAGAPPPAFVRTERGWLVPTVVIILVAAALIVAGVLVSGSRKGSTPTAGSSRAGGAVTIAHAQAFDPPPGNGEENNGDVAKTVDGDPSTVWQTEGYNNRSLGKLKPGVGVALTLDKAAPLDKLTVESPTNDWSAEIFVSDTTHPDLTAWGDPVTTKEHINAGTTTFDLGGHTGAAVLVWITDLGDGAGDSSGRVHAQIAEIHVTGK